LVQRKCRPWRTEARGGSSCAESLDHGKSAGERPDPHRGEQRGRAEGERQSHASSRSGLRGGATAS
jgi:hypothetical protein